LGGGDPNEDLDQFGQLEELVGEYLRVDADMEELQKKKAAATAATAAAAEALPYSAAGGGGIAPGECAFTDVRYAMQCGNARGAGTTREKAEASCLGNPNCPGIAGRESYTWSATPPSSWGAMETHDTFQTCEKGVDLHEAEDEVWNYFGKVRVTHPPPSQHAPAPPMTPLPGRHPGLPQRDPPGTRPGARAAVLRNVRADAGQPRVPGRGGKTAGKPARQTPEPSDLHGVEPDRAALRQYVVSPDARLREQRDHGVGLPNR
jgi:hypothetical protein